MSLPAPFFRPFFQNSCASGAKKETLAFHGPGSPFPFSSVALGPVDHATMLPRFFWLPGFLLGMAPDLISLLPNDEMGFMTAEPFGQIRICHPDAIAFGGVAQR